VFKSHGPLTIIHEKARNLRLNQSGLSGFSHNRQGGNHFITTILTDTTPDLPGTAESLRISIIPDSPNIDADGLHVVVTFTAGIRIDPYVSRASFG